MRRHTSVLLSLCILGFVGACASGGYEYEEPESVPEFSGAILYEQTRRREGSEGASDAVLDQYTSAWEAGSVASAKRLAEIFQNGYGGQPVDHVEAVRWLERAADGGDAESRYNLGCMYYFGRGVEQSAATAAQHWGNAAVDNLAAAQTNLGALYLTGDGVPQNYEESSHWFRRAAERGDATGQLKLALSHKNGWGVKLDEAAALRWMSSAASQGDPDAQYYMGTFCETGYGMEADRIAAAHWYWMATESGYADARGEFERIDSELRLEADSGGARGLCYLGCALREGIGVVADPEAAYAWFERAAQNKDPQGTFELARCYADGIGVEPDAQRALDTCVAAAQLGHAAANYEVALMIQDIDGYDAEPHERAMGWMRVAAERGHVAARLHVYEDEMLFKSALYGLAWAQRELGLAFVEGSLQRIDYAAARYWLELAHAQADAVASLALGKLLLAGGATVTLLGRTTFEPDPLGAVRALEHVEGAERPINFDDTNAMFATSAAVHEARPLLAKLYADHKSPAYDLDRAIMWANLAAESGDYTSIPIVQAEIDRVNDAELDRLLSTPSEGDPYFEPVCGFCGGSGLVLSVRGHYVGSQYWGDQYTTCLDCMGTGLLSH